MKEAIDRILNGLYTFLKSANHQKAVLGLSGGIDSALVAKLAMMAIGKENVTTLILPNEGMNSEESAKDAQEFAEELGINHHTISINDYLERYQDLPWKPSKLADMNIQARVRATILYHYANTHGALVLGTGNKTELMLGYFTKHGDGACDVLPIGALYKTDVWEMSKQLNLPDKIINKAPSAELQKAQTDEEEIGMTYAEIDVILKKFEAGGKPITHKEMIIEKRIRANLHKNKLVTIL